jgi:hypothetical protein
LLAIRRSREYDEAVKQLNELVDKVGDNPHDPRYCFIETLSISPAAFLLEPWRR